MPLTDEQLLPFSGVDFGFEGGLIPSPHVDEIKRKAEARRERKRQRNLRLAGKSTIDG